MKRKDLKKEILERGYITHALTNDKEIFGLVEYRTISDWSHDKPLYWSEVYCEPGYMATIIRKGMLLVDTSDEELSLLHEQSKVNLH